MPKRFKKVEQITTEELRKLFKESGLTVSEIEKGVGMPHRTLSKTLDAKPATKSGHIRTLPTKWVAKTIRFIKEKKAENEELKLEIKEILIENNIPVVEPEVFIPNEQQKMDWINKLQEAHQEAN